mgnify:FL=1
MQVRLRAAVYEMGALVYGTDTRGEPLWPDKPTTGIMALWGQALADVAAIRHADDDTRLNMQPEASRVEWLMKWQLLERLRRRHGLSWNDPKLRAIDLGWAALDPVRSIFEKVRSRTERTVDDRQVADAAGNAPQTTRAWLRAAVVNRYASQVVAVSWSHLTVRRHDAPQMGEESYGNASRPIVRPSDLCSLDMSDPCAFDKAHMAAFVDGTRNADELITQIDRNITAGR